MNEIKRQQFKKQLDQLSGSIFLAAWRIPLKQPTPCSNWLANCSSTWAIFRLKACG
ncbi:MAG: hypothetical protein L6461_11265 [Anaerolineae bacterium]|nr:hypothetical protein [Anaerolineae bacterium]